jgi:hypothetical protein
MFANYRCLSIEFTVSFSCRLRVMSWIEFLPAEDDPLSDTKNHELKVPYYLDEQPVCLMVVPLFLETLD